MRHTLSIIVADQPGELSRIVGLFSARGFNNTLANKLLVMIDGRSVYTPLDAGVPCRQVVKIRLDGHGNKKAFGPLRLRGLTVCVGPKGPKGHKLLPASNLSRKTFGPPRTHERDRIEMNPSVF